MLVVGMLLGGNKDTVQKQTTEIFEFEKNLAQIYVKRDKTNVEKAYNKMTVADLQKLCPAVCCYFNFIWDLLFCDICR